MRARASLLLALLALVSLPAAAGADPSDVYVDYASDGTLECGHSRADLEGLLTDASINEYGDPLMLTRLKIAVRRQLAVGCGNGAAPPATTTDEPADPATASDPAASPEATESSSGATTAETTSALETTTGAVESLTEPVAPSTPEPQPETVPSTGAATVAAGPTADGDDGDSGGGLAMLAVVGVAGIAALAAGGWLARRSLTRS